MRHLRAAPLLAVALMSGGCFQLATVVHVKGDASGTVEQRLVFSPAALTQIKQFGTLGGSSGRSADPTSEAQARADAARLGPGATFVSSRAISNDEGWQGRASVYAFTDINQLRVNPQPPPPGGVTVRADGIDSRGKAITFTLDRRDNGNAVLTIQVPLPELPAGGLPSRGNTSASDQIAFLKQVFGGARAAVAVEPAGTLVRTNSRFVDGPRVTLLDVDLDELLKDETLLPRVQAAKSADELKTVLEGAPGLKINFDRAITIEFTPAR